MAIFIFTIPSLITFSNRKLSKNIYIGVSYCVTFGILLLNENNILLTKKIKMKEKRKFSFFFFNNLFSVLA